MPAESTAASPCRLLVCSVSKERTRAHSLFVKLRQVQLRAEHERREVLLLHLLYGQFVGVCLAECAG